MGEKLTRTQQKNLERLGGVNPADESFSRRQFVQQVGTYAAVAGGAVGAGLLVKDQWGMEGVKPPPPVTPEGLQGRAAPQPPEHGGRPRHAARRRSRSRARTTNSAPAKIRP